MIRVTLHTHNQETEPTYRMVDEKNGYFVYGEGHQKARKTKVIEIEGFKYEGCKFSLNELTDFAINNKDYFLKYLTDYGYRAIADQVDITSSDVATSKSYNFLRHMQTHPLILDYIQEVKIVYNEFIELISKAKVGTWTKLSIRDLDFDKFCFYDWMGGGWQIYIISRNGLTPFTNLLKGYELENNLKNMSIKDTLNHLSGSDLGDRIESLLSYNTYLEGKK